MRFETMNVGSVWMNECRSRMNMGTSSWMTLHTTLDLECVCVYSNMRVVGEKEMSKDQKWIYRFACIVFLEVCVCF